MPIQELYVAPHYLRCIAECMVLSITQKAHNKLLWIALSGHVYFNSRCPILWTERDEWPVV